MSGCGECAKYWKILDSFGYDFQILLDLDALNNKGNTFANIDKTLDDIVTKDINIRTSNKDAAPLKDSNLDVTKKEKKHHVIDSLKKYNIDVLPEGMIEDYLDEQGKPIDADREKELKSIFSIK